MLNIKQKQEVPQISMFSIPWCNSTDNMVQLIYLGPRVQGQYKYPTIQHDGYDIRTKCKIAVRQADQYHTRQIILHQRQDKQRGHQAQPFTNISDCGQSIFQAPTMPEVPGIYRKHTLRYYIRHYRLLCPTYQDEDVRSAKNPQESVGE